MLPSLNKVFTYLLRFCVTREGLLTNIRDFSTLSSVRTTGWLKWISYLLVFWIRENGIFLFVILFFFPFVNRARDSPVSCKLYCSITEAPVQDRSRFKCLISKLLVVITSGQWHAYASALKIFSHSLPPSSLSSFSLPLSFWLNWTSEVQQAVSGTKKKTTKRKNKR